MKQQKRNRPKSCKTGQRKITNWSSYNQALKERGSLNIWICEELLNNWHYQGERQQGAQYQYSDTCILTGCLVKEIYHLPYRQTQGFLESLVKLLNWKVKVPHYTVLNRRRRTLDIKILDSKEEKKHIVIDSTGAKVYGEGEWKVRQYGWGKRRTWMKIHLAVNEKNGEIESCATTTNSIDDASMVEPLLKNIKGEIEKFGGDGAYDKRKVYEELEKKNIQPIIPPQTRARTQKHGNCLGKEYARDINIRAIRKLGKKKWKKEFHYHRRSIAETTMFRFKIIFGDKLNSRLTIQQEIEVKLKCLLLNQMLALGRPTSIKEA